MLRLRSVLQNFHKTSLNTAFYLIEFYKISMNGCFQISHSSLIYMKLIYIYFLSSDIYTPFKGCMAQWMRQATYNIWN